MQRTADCEGEGTDEQSVDQCRKSRQVRKQDAPIDIQNRFVKKVDAVTYGSEPGGPASVQSPKCRHGEEDDQRQAIGVGVLEPVLVVPHVAVVGESADDRQQDNECASKQADGSTCGPVV